MTAVISIEGLSKSLSGRQVLKDLSFDVQPGDIFGCLGPNGAGKTTTIRVILGLLRASGGTVRVLGTDPADDAVRNRLGFLLEVDGLYDHLSAWDNLAFYGRLYGLRDAGARIEAVLAGAGLADRAQDKISAYSKGMRQRLALARALLHRPEILVLDEPTAGLDPGGQRDVRRMLLELREEGTTIFLSSHNLDEMQRLCNRIVLIHGGRIRLYGELDELARGSGRGGVVVETSAPIPGEVLPRLEQTLGAAVEQGDGAVVTLTGGAGFAAPDAVAFLVQEGVRIEQVTKQQDSLEDLYVRIEAEARSAEGGGAGGGSDGARGAGGAAAQLPRGAGGRFRGKGGRHG
jgi:ABC-2 type transport system ATP-binding protein